MAKLRAFCVLRWCYLNRFCRNYTCKKTDDSGKFCNISIKNWQFALKPLFILVLLHKFKGFLQKNKKTP